MMAFKSYKRILLVLLCFHLQDSSSLGTNIINRAPWIVYPSNFATRRSFWRLGASMNNDEFDRNTMDSIHDEEILMRMHLSVKDSVDPMFALSEIIRFTQTFSFTAILPVQPMRYDKTDKGMVLKSLPETKSSCLEALFSYYPIRVSQRCE
jgi:hypothetical protein